MGLKHETNIYGDGINMTGCRSFWNDEYGRRFGCEQLLDGGKDVVMDEIKREHPEYRPVFKPYTPKNKPTIHIWHDDRNKRSLLCFSNVLRCYYLILKSN